MLRPRTHNSQVIGIRVAKKSDIVLNFQIATILGIGHLRPRPSVDADASLTNRFKAGLRLRPRILNLPPVSMAARVNAITYGIV